MKRVELTWRYVDGISLNMEGVGGAIGVCGGLDAAEEFPEEPSVPAAAAAAAGPACCPADPANECTQQPRPAHVADSAFMAASEVSSRLVKDKT